MGVGEGGTGGATFMTQVLGAPATLKEGPLITCKKKAIFWFFEASGAKRTIKW